MDQQPSEVSSVKKVYLHVKMVYHLNQLYFVVFKDHHEEFISDVWVRDMKVEHQRRVIWSMHCNRPPTQRVKNICIKALRKPLAVAPSATSVPSTRD